MWCPSLVYIWNGYNFSTSDQVQVLDRKFGGGYERGTGNTYDIRAGTSVKNLNLSSALVLSNERIKVKVGIAYLA